MIFLVMYRVGKCKYNSKACYQRLLIFVFIVFLVCLVLLFQLEEHITPKLFNFTVAVDLAMLVHLFLRYMHSEKHIHYPLNEY